MDAKSWGIIHPKPYFEVKFGCSNRRFYDVKNELYEIAESIGIEIQDGYISETCDYEGDLEKITIYRGGRNEKLAQAVLKFYGIKEEISEDLPIVLILF